MRVLARLHERVGETLGQHVSKTLGERDAIQDATLTLAICGDMLVGLASGDRLPGAGKHPPAPA